MSIYFDRINRDLGEMFREYRGTYSQQVLDQFLVLETHVTNEVSLVTGDREFPDDLRERIQGIIAVYAVFPMRTGWPVNYKAASAVLATKSSDLFARLHSAFHDVASRRVMTRFGLLNDDPTDILKRRDAHDTALHPDKLKDLVR